MMGFYGTAALNGGPGTSSISTAWELVRNAILGPHSTTANPNLGGLGPKICIIAF